MTVGIRLETHGVVVLALGLSLLVVGVLSDNAFVALWGQVVLGAVALLCHGGVALVDRSPLCDRTGACYRGAGRRRFRRRIRRRPICRCRRMVRRRLGPLLTMDAQRSPLF